jgi:Fungal specific transcription factor domain
MMMVALISFKRLREEPAEYRGRTDQMYRDYRRLTGQCLALLDYQHPSNYTIEILLLYMLAEVAASRDMESALMMGVTMTIRLAMRMGYHRDSKYFPDMSPFAGEMRRRVWAILQSSDLKMSAQFGLPPMIRTDVCNTENPRNLYDDELTEDMPVLPQSRPISESTPMAYIIYKSDLIQVCYRVVEEVQRLKGGSYETIMGLDAELRAVHEKIPPHLRLRPLGESMQTEQSSVILKRYMLEIQYLKYLCLVHRKYAGMPRAEYSTRTCISSAMDILGYQVILFDGLKPGGLLSDSKIFVTSLATHDFLLAAMIVSTHLYRLVEADKLNGMTQPDEQERDRRGKMRYAIEQSMRIWDAAKEESLEALKAAGALAAMLKMLTDQDTKIRATFGGAGSGAGASVRTYSSSTLAQTSSFEDTKLEPEHHAAMTLGMLSSGGNANGQPAPGYFPTTTSAVFGDVTAGTAPNTGATFSAATEPAVDAPSPFSTLFNSAGFGRLPNYAGSSGSNSISGGSAGSAGWELPNGVDWVSYFSPVWHF